MKEFFEEGSVQINTCICDGVECKLCIDACPTNALYWDSGEVKVSEELCVFCTACVLSCIVDDCIQVRRRRANGEVEEFSTPREALLLQHRINTEKRTGRVESRKVHEREVPSLHRIRSLPPFLSRYGTESQERVKEAD